MRIQTENERKAIDYLCDSEKVYNDAKTHPCDSEPEYGKAEDLHIKSVECNKVRFDFVGKEITISIDIK